MYQRRYRSRRPQRRYQRRPAKHGYFGQAGTDASKALAMAGKALSLINTEHKIIDADASANVTTTAQIILLNGVGQGDDNFQRNGRSIKMTSTYFRGTAVKATPATTTFLRMMIVEDHQCNGAIFGITDVLVTATIDSPRNVDEGKRFKVLKDKVYTLNSDHPQIFIKHFSKLDDHVEFKGTVNTVASISTNSLYLVLLSTEAVDFPVVNYYNRVRFIDN